MAKKPWKSGWDEDGDRPIGEQDEAPPERGAPAMSETELEWQDRLAREDRQQQIKDRKIRARPRFAWPLLHRERPEKPEKRRSAGEGPRIAAQVVPYAALLLLAPFIDNPVWFYLLLLFTAVPLALAAISLRPLGHGGRLFRMLAPLLPAEAWLALRYGLWNPVGALVLVGLCALLGSLYFIFAVRDRGEREGRDRAERPGRSSQQPQLEVKGRRQERRERSRSEKAASLAYGRRLLLFVTLLAAISLAVPAVLGLGMALVRFQPNEASDFERASMQDDELMARRVAGVYGQLQPDQWELLSRDHKRKALQAMLDLETDSLGIDRFDLRDPMVHTAVSGAGHFSVPQALLSGKGKSDDRVHAMCHLAYHLMQLSVTENVTLHRFEEMADGYANTRLKLYAAQAALQEPEVDHAR